MNLINNKPYILTKYKKLLNLVHKTGDLMKKVISNYEQWLITKRLKPNTIKIYIQCVKDIEKFDIVDDDDLTITGKINKYLSKESSYKAPSSLQVYKIACKSFITFLYETKSSNMNSREFELLRRKKNIIIANIELPKLRKYRMDLKSFYISSNNMLNIFNGFKIKNIPNYQRKPLAILSLIMYDTSCRINEVISNKWENVSKEGFFVPKEISKISKPHYVPWLIPECYNILMEMKGKNKEKDTLLPMLNNNKVWRAYQIVSPSLKPSAHWFRHTRLMDLAGEGWELGKLQRRAGHTTVTSTTHYINYVSQAKSYIQFMRFEKWCKEKGIKISSLV